MPKPVTLNLVPKSFGDGYFWIAAFQGNEEIGPLGLGNSPTEAVNELVGAAEAMLALRAAPARQSSPSYRRSLNEDFRHQRPSFRRP